MCSHFAFSAAIFPNHSIFAVIWENCGITAWCEHSLHAVIVAAGGGGRAVYCQLSHIRDCKEKPEVADPLGNIQENSAYTSQFSIMTQKREKNMSREELQACVNCSVLGGEK